MKPCKITVDLYNTFRERMPEYVQYDRNVPLEITVLENGKPADLNGLFGRLLVSKPDGHEVYSNDVEINGNVITTTLGEQVFTASGVAQVTVDILDEQNSKRALVPFGMRIRSAVITDESIKSSNDYQTITALISDVRALNAMFHVEQEQRVEAFNAQMQSQEATFTEAQRQFLADHREVMLHVEQQMTEQADMFHVEQAERAKAFEQSEADREQRFEAQTTELVQTVAQTEATRQSNEERRQSAEDTRGNAEKARESAERQRVDTEAVRQRQEQERGQGEAGRATAEANRVKAEQTRVDSESSRESAESSRVNAESQRATAESHRATAETSRATAESQRATAETNRAGAEGRRSEAESNRVTAENNRATAESKRVTAENTRETQENARREAEEDRATRMAQWEAKAEETAQKAQEAVDSAQAFVNTNEERLLTDRDKIDYMGNQHESLKAKNDSDIEWLLGEVNTVHYDGQHITATDTIEGRSKSATLKGNTLVNLISDTSFESTSWTKYSYESYENGVITFVGNGQRLVRYAMHKTPVKKNQTYTAFVKIKSDCANVGIELETNDGDTYIRSSNYTTSETNDFVLLKAIITVKNHNTLAFVLRATELINGNVYFKEPILLEGDYTNQEIPFFSGIQSVKMPVLTTTGKNLFDKSFMLGNIDGNGNVIQSTTNIISNPIKVNSNKTYSVSGVDKYIANSKLYYIEYDENMRLIKTGINFPFTTSSNCKHVRMQINETTDVEGINSLMQIEESLISTSYEPYKTNILTVNEDVELRGIGDVQDELNLLIGELTQRIGEVVLDGSENWVKPSTQPTNTSRFLLVDFPNNKNAKILSNIRVKNNAGEDAIGIWCDTNTVLNVDTSIDTVESLKVFLSENPIKLQYSLATESIKTVDLSDNHVYSYKDVTHYDCSSAEGSLVPTLSIDVPTNLPAVVARQRATIQELEKENQELAHAVTIVDEHREEGDLELLSSDFDFELRLMEIEFAIGVSMMANYKGVRNMARTPYDMAKALILGGKYEREEMVAKLDRFEKLGSITADQKAELIALMDAVELTQ